MKPTCYAWGPLPSTIRMDLSHHPYANRMDWLRGVTVFIVSREGGGLIFFKTVGKNFPTPFMVINHHPLILTFKTPGGGKVYFTPLSPIVYVGPDSPSYFLICLGDMFCAWVLKCIIWRCHYKAANTQSASPAFVLNTPMSYCFTQTSHDLTWIQG